MRISVPTFPGSATRHSARAGGLVPGARQIGPAETAITRGGWASVEISASSSGVTSSPATSRSTGSSAGGPGLDEILALAHEEAEPARAAGATAAGGSTSGAGSTRT